MFPDNIYLKKLNLTFLIAILLFQSKIIFVVLKYIEEINIKYKYLD